MAKTTISFCLAAMGIASAHAASTIGAHSLTFKCVVRDPRGDLELPLFFDTLGRSSDDLKSVARGMEIFEVLRRDNIFANLDSSYVPDIHHYHEECEVMTGGKIYKFPVDFFGDEGYQFVAYNLLPTSNAFKRDIESLRFSPLGPKQSGSLFLQPSSRGEGSRIDADSCSMPADHRRASVFENGNKWNFIVKDLGLIFNSQYLPIRSESNLVAYVSTLKTGLTFSKDLYESVMKMIVSSLEPGRVVVKNGGVMFVSDCHWARPEGVFGKKERMFEIVTALDGQGGNGIRFFSETFIARADEVDANTCRLNIFMDEKLAENEIIFGDAFFRASDVEFSGLNNGLAVCPYSVYSPSHEVSNEVPYLVQQPLVQVASRYAQKPSDYSLLIGLLVGGCVLIFGVIAFFIFRAKRKNRLMAQEESGRFAPTRPMVDPSEISSNISA